MRLSNLDKLLSRLFRELNIAGFFQTTAHCNDHVNLEVREHTKIAAQ